NIGYFFYIGGNDSMDTVSKLSRYAKAHHQDIRFIGIPKTIDNDLVQTDHTPGFGSAAKYVATTVREIGIDASVYDNKKSVTIIEIMGRHAGWLTAASVLARKFQEDNPRLIYLPEVDFDQQLFIEHVKTALETTPNLVVCISEGIHDEEGTFICELASEVSVDSFGHKMLAGSGKYLENLVKEKLGIKVRSVELNVSQRCSATCLSATDLEEAVQAGVYGVQGALAGETGKMVSFLRAEHTPYKMTCTMADVDDICNAEKGVPTEWIIKEGSDISSAFI
ncbi:MAG: diphosphate--fructose-6-phosphate 1-phosphotransferase, partial [Lachnospiraceae bacterium]